MDVFFQALLPLDKICSFDWKFDSKNKSDPVIEIFDLPLTFVKSLTASDLVLSEKNTCSKLRVSVSYRKYNNDTSQVMSHEQMYTEKEEVLTTAGQTNIFHRELGSTDKKEFNQGQDGNDYSKQIEDSINNRAFSDLSEAVKVRGDEHCDPADSNSKESMKKSDYSESELKYLRRRFWTGEYETNPTKTKSFSIMSNSDQVLDIDKSLENSNKISGKRVEFNDSNFKKNYQDLTHVPNYRFHDEPRGIDSRDLKDSRFRTRVNFLDTDYDIKKYRLKHRSYDSLTDCLSTLYSEGNQSHTSERVKSDDARSYKVKYLSYEDIREGLHTSDVKPLSSERLCISNNHRLAQKSYESFRDTENTDLRCDTHKEQFKVDFSGLHVDSSCHRLNDQFITSDLRYESGKNYDAVDSSIIGCNYKYRSDFNDVDKRYNNDSGSNLLLIDTSNGRTGSTNEPLHAKEGSSIDLHKTDHSDVRNNSDLDNTISDVMVNSDHSPLTTGKSELTANKIDSQYYNDEESSDHKMTSDIQNIKSTETVEIFVANKRCFDDKKSEDSILESHVIYTDRKSVDNLCEVEHSVSEGKQISDKLNESDGSIESGSQSESQNMGKNIELQHLENSFQDSGSRISNTKDLNQSSLKSKKYFQAHIEIEQAMHLPMRRKCVNGVQTLTQPSTYVTFKVNSEDKDVLYSTSVVQENCNPIWNKIWEVALPVELLQEVSICYVDNERTRNIHLILFHFSSSVYVISA